MPKGTSCHAQLPPRLLTDLQRAVYVPGMVRDDAGIKRVEGEVHLGDVGVDHLGDVGSAQDGLPLTVVAYLASPSPKPDVSKVQMMAFGVAHRVSKVRRSACNTRQQQRARPERPWAQNRGQNAASPTSEMVTKVTSLYSCAKTVSQCWRDIRTLPGPVEFIRSSPLPAELSPGQ